jgi:hypothetical protein
MIATVMGRIGEERKVSLLNSETAARSWQGIREATKLR